MKIDLKLLLQLLQLLATQDEQVIPVPVPSPVPAPQPQPPTSQPKVLESWFEEFWHDWFKGSLPGESDSDWAPMDSPKWTAIVTGIENLPAGSSIRVMSGVHVDGKPAILPTGFSIKHNFEFTPEVGTPTSGSITSEQVAQDGFQPFPDLGHVQHSQRNWGPRVQGCAVTFRLNPGLGKGTLKYWATSLGDPHFPAPPASISVGGK